jgi:hypothetical protein
MRRFATKDKSTPICRAPDLCDDAVGFAGLGFAGYRSTRKTVSIA